MSSLVEIDHTRAGWPAAASASEPPLVALAALGEHPPKARLALNVGIVAHAAEGAPAALSPATREQVTAVLASAAADAHAAAPTVFRDEAPRLRVILSQAIGPEHEVARAALDRGFEVQIVLAGDREALARSLSPAARAGLAPLLERATAMPELDSGVDGSTAAREAAAAATEVLLDQSDLLLVLGDADTFSSRDVWYTVGQARARELAMVTIPSQAPADMGIAVCDRVGSLQQVDLAALHDHLVAMVSPPAATQLNAETADQGKRPDPIGDYFAEVIPARTWLAWTWSLFVGIVADGRNAAWPRVGATARTSTTVRKRIPAWCRSPISPNPRRITTAPPRGKPCWPFWRSDSGSNAFSSRECSILVS